jgi:hypothetical protein
MISTPATHQYSRTLLLFFGQATIPIAQRHAVQRPKGLYAITICLSRALHESRYLP